MNSKPIRSDAKYTQPSAEIAVMGPKGAAEIIFRKEIGNSENPAAMLAQKDKEYREKFANPFLAAERGYLDEVIEPRFTRTRIIQALCMLENKSDANPLQKHGNIPL